MKQKQQSLGQSFKDAFSGIRFLWRTQRNIRIHGMMAVFVLVLGAYLKLNKQGFVYLILAIGIVWTAEAFNTVIEILTNIISPEYTSKATGIKDMSAAAVLIAAMSSALIGFLVLGPPLISQFFTSV